MSLNTKSLSTHMKNNLGNMGISKLSRVQEDSFDAIYDGYDVMIQSRTGNGETLAFGIPIVEHLLSCDYRHNSISLLALAPTKELAHQICTELKQISGLEVLCVDGGGGIDTQISRLRYGVDIVVGTPETVDNLLHRKVLKFDGILHLVIDDVDKMLDMGFMASVENIIRNVYESTPNKPQLVLLSATLPLWVYEAAELYMFSNYVRIDGIISEDSELPYLEYNIIMRKINAVEGYKVDNYLPIASRIMSCDKSDELFAALVSLVLSEQPIPPKPTISSDSSFGFIQNDRRSSYRHPISLRPRDYFGTGSNFSFK